MRFPGTAGLWPATPKKRARRPRSQEFPGKRGLRIMLTCPRYIGAYGTRLNGPCRRQPSVKADRRRGSFFTSKPRAARVCAGLAAIFVADTMHLLTLTMVAVPLWVFAAAAALIVTAIAIAIYLATSRRSVPSPGQPPATCAEILGIRWRWKNEAGDVSEISSFCPRCDRPIQPKEETRHGFLHLISFECDCRKWRSKSFQCSHSDFIDRIHATIQQQSRCRS
jgi:hypothetical protein